MAAEAQAPMSVDDVADALRRDLDARELRPEDAQASPAAPVPGDAPCRYFGHRASDRTGEGGKRICTVCHPLPAPPAASSRPEPPAPVPTASPAPGAAEAIRRALIDEAEDTREATGPTRETVPGTGGLLYRGVAACLFSERGAGKSMAVLILLLGAAAGGERVLYLDRENGGALTRERVEAILAAHPEWGDPLSDGRFVGRHWPGFDLGWNPTAYGEALAGFTVVGYDSLREVLSQLGLDPDRERDISRFVDLAVTPLVSRGVTVLIPDNVGHDNPDRPKGSGAKLDAIPTAYRVVAREPFGPEQTGRLEVRCTRSRLGDEGRAWTMRVGGDHFDPPTPFVDPTEKRRADSDAEDRADFLAAATQALEAEGPLGRDRLLDAARSRGAKTRATKAREWLAVFAEDPAHPIFHDPESGYSLLPDPPGPDLRDHPRTTPPEAPGPAGGRPPVGGHPSDRPGPSGPDQARSSSSTPAPEVEGDGGTDDPSQPAPAGEQEGPDRVGASSGQEGSS